MFDMTFDIIQTDASRLADFYKIPIAFEVHSVYDVVDNDADDVIRLIERPLAVPYVKDYDQLADCSPHSWSKMNISHWAFFLALDKTQNDRPAGGAVVAMPDCALWDLRIAPAYRRQGVGRALWNHLIDWVKQHGTKTRLSIETQNTNVPACRFYASMGAKLGDIDRTAYADHDEVKHEIRLNWYFDLNRE